MITTSNIKTHVSIFLTFFCFIITFSKRKIVINNAISLYLQAFRDKTKCTGLMKISDDLFQLIKALERSEKRYFKITMSMTAGNLKQNQIDLFDAIDKMEVYDEEKLKKKFSKRAFVKQFHVTKNRLYKSILKSLDSYYSEQTPEDQLNHLLHQAEILLDKNLFTQSKKLLDRAKKIATDQELFLYLLQIQVKEVQFFVERYNYEKLRLHASEGYERGLDILDRYKNLMEMNRLSSKISEYISRKRTDSNIASVTQIFTEDDKALLSDEKKALSFDALNRMLIINSVYYRLTGELEKSMKFRERLVELLEDNMEKIQGKPKVYISALNNLLGIQVQLSHYKATESTLNKLQDILNSKYFKLNEKYTLDIIVRVITGQLTYYTNTKQLDKLKELLPGIKEQLYQYDEFINFNHKLVIQYYIGFFYFCNEEWSMAMEWFRKLLDDPKIDLREDIMAHVKVLNLITIYELGYNSLLESSIKSTYRFIRKKKFEFKFENLILRFLKRGLFMHDKEELKELFMKLKDELMKLMDETSEREAISTLNLTYWLDSQIQGVSFKSLLVKDQIKVEELPN